MIGLIDYEAGNIRSVANALHTIGAKFIISAEPAVLAGCDGIILPGVGAAPGAMRSLLKNGLTGFIPAFTKPFLGICLGMELLLSHSEEGNIDCLGVLPATVRKFDTRAEKIPHMGWNQIESTRENLLLKGLPDHPYFYFAHSFYVPVDDAATAVTTCGVVFASMVVARENFYGVQFHPEKSGPAGLTLLNNFDALCRSFRQ